MRGAGKKMLRIGVQKLEPFYPNSPPLPVDRESIFVRISKTNSFKRAVPKICWLNFQKAILYVRFSRESEAYKRG